MQLLRKSAWAELVLNNLKFGKEGRYGQDPYLEKRTRYSLVRTC